MYVNDKQIIIKKITTCISNALYTKKILYSQSIIDTKHKYNLKILKKSLT
jgi:hypothetical protein